ATVKTLLGRLVKKGALRAEKNGRAFNYYPMV
ncbi:uracil phosphoribosyltransferase, partial [Lactiplantibacillus plantarum]